MSAQSPALEDATAAAGGASTAGASQLDGRAGVELGALTMLTTLGSVEGANACADGSCALQ
jgi:hypothetical protein